MTTKFLSLFCVIVLLSGGVSGGPLQLADPYTEHAVMQQGVELPVWGSAAPAATVTVQFAGQAVSTQANAEGHWQVTLAPLKAASMGSKMVVATASERVEIDDLLVGEVWYASGQSNMQMTLNACAAKNPTIREIAASHTSGSIRFLRIDDPDSPQPNARRSNASMWQPDSTENLRRQSAVAFFFAREVQRELDVPVGIIEGSWGGKPIEGFIPEKQFKQHETLDRILSLAKQDQLDELAKVKGGVVVRNTAGLPGRIFNARVAPIVRFPVRGILWYQGESNAGRGEDPRDYRFKMHALIQGWREAWKHPQLPFYFVQLPAYKAESTGWIRLREEQRLSLAIEHTGMAVTIDLRDSDIHPANKLDVGKRLALWALAKTYHHKITFSGPLFRRAVVEAESMRVEFEHGDGGLMVAHKVGLEAPKQTADVELQHFELAGADGIWYPASATIEGSGVVVRCNEVTSPIAVRYACGGAPTNANLYNRAGLPASPFCSDLELLPWEANK